MALSLRYSGWLAFLPDKRCSPSIPVPGNVERPCRSAVLGAWGDTAFRIGRCGTPFPYRQMRNRSKE